MKQSVRNKRKADESDCGEGSSTALSVSLRNVSKVYPGPGEGEVALRNVTLDLRGPGMLAVVGKSGCGKSTLLNLITGIDQPTEGEISVLKRRIHDLDETSGANWRKDSVGIVFQSFQLLPSLTALENVLLPMSLSKRLAPDRQRERARELLEQVDLLAHAEKLPHALSGGQQQRCAIARALANDPSIIVADEPTGNLDTESSRRILDILIQLSRKGKLVVIVTHDPEVASLADQVVTLSNGQVESVTDNNTLPA